MLDSGVKLQYILIYGVINYDIANIEHAQAINLKAEQSHKLRIFLKIFSIRSLFVCCGQSELLTSALKRICTRVMICLQVALQSLPQVFGATNTFYDRPL